MFPQPFAPDHPSAAPSPDGHLPLLVALRAIAALIIVWHHFAIYPPLREWAAPLAGGLLDGLAAHARATQVFFVIGGYVMARSLADGFWDGRRTASFLIQRYWRLGLPYLAAIALAIAAASFARGWVPDDVLGTPVSLPQLLAHIFFLQDILGYEQLSAGLWFVCINFQLCALYAAGLWLRDRVSGGRIDFVALGGWTLAIASLFHFNLDADWDRWAVYFFPYFFMGIVVHRALASPKGQIQLWTYLALFILAMSFEWRWRLAIAGAVGVLLFVAEASGLAARWPRNRWLARLGEVSLSLFLVHFPVLVLTGALWTRLGWNSPLQAMAGLGVAFAASIAAAFTFHRWVEIPASRLARRQRAARIPAHLNRKGQRPAFEG
jgi:peptidoglycan/LPS O-acetylase OafA/YrhL